MSKSGSLVYKCRRCEKVYKGYQAPDIEIATAHMAVGLHMPDKWGSAQPTMTDYHTCPDGNIGITDCIGGEADSGEED